MDSCALRYVTVLHSACIFNACLSHSNILNLLFILFAIVVFIMNEHLASKRWFWGCLRQTTNCGLQPSTCNIFLNSLRSG